MTKFLLTWLSNIIWSGREAFVLHCYSKINDGLLAMMKASPVLWTQWIVLRENVAVVVGAEAGHFSRIPQAAPLGVLWFIVVWLFISLPSETRKKNYPRLATQMKVNSQIRSDKTKLSCRVLVALCSHNYPVFHIVHFTSAQTNKKTRPMVAPSVLNWQSFKQGFGSAPAGGNAHYILPLWTCIHNEPTNYLQEVTDAFHKLKQ